MRSIADFLRAAVPGSVWHCTNHRHPEVSGERRITGGKTALRYTGTRADGTTFDNGRMDIPRRDTVRIAEDSITWLNPNGSDEYVWTLVRNDAPDRERSADKRRVEAYAAKFVAETTCAEPPIAMEPTDDNLRATFANCGRPDAVAGLYDEIRAEIARLVTEHAATPAPYVSGWTEGAV
jgi:hypothetical protein